ncbi:MAG: hypothetical protein FJ275_04520 [Planctomycetes bacterium]|nr:hypothetical protein [Planctomycetota bacterium]
MVRPPAPARIGVLADHDHRRRSERMDELGGVWKHGAGGDGGIARPMDIEPMPAGDADMPFPEEPPMEALPTPRLVGLEGRDRAHKQVGDGVHRVTRGGAGR